ncbi:hypothetical protein SAMN03159443_01492 [Pseudomonas sp. NFACC15-1]|uniref:sugar porter family MFS transporter n=1 Tax=unclassified Pseudomonas TaxID=196821 RepID=UPI00088B223C|nr:MULTISPECIES: sugar porter family MFS transporter [unclassified Pseudomonas]SDA57515.1 hypothetical protein SAMN03159443_01492 [Pseudomonas sp. NFACC15-1]SDX62657.1 hypothetical protein SAMN03159380_02581 [Pseudomonas sp. NFACC14]
MHSNTLITLLALPRKQVLPTLDSAPYIPDFSYGRPRAKLQVGETFFVFVGAGLLSPTFVAVWVPETRGSTLEEIEQRLYG